MQRLAKCLWGIALLAVGVLLLLRAVGVITVSLLFDGWWTLFILVPCTIGLITEREKTGSLIGLLIGVFLLMACQDILSFDLLWKLVLPVVILLIGARLLIGALRPGKKALQPPATADGVPAGQQPRSGFAAFSGATLDMTDELFEGAELTAVFGGVRCDLTHALFEKDCTINARAIFGGVEIALPPTVNVKVYSNAAFGGISAKQHRNSDSNLYTVYVDGTCLFGGIDIQ